MSKNLPLDDEMAELAIERLARSRIKIDDDLALGRSSVAFTAEQSDYVKLENKYAGIIPDLGGKLKDKIIKIQAEEKRRKEMMKTSDMIISELGEVKNSMANLGLSYKNLLDVLDEIKTELDENIKNERQTTNDSLTHSGTENFLSTLTVQNKILAVVSSLIFMIILLLLTVAMYKIASSSVEINVELNVAELIAGFLAGLGVIFAGGGYAYKVFTERNSTSLPQ